MIGLHAYLVNVLSILLCLQSLVTASAASFSPYSLTNKTLILYDDSIEENFASSYSTFLELVQLNGLDYDLKAVSPSLDVQLFDKLDARLFDNVIIFPAKTRELARSISVTTLEKFSEKGGNLLIVSGNKGTQTDVAAFLNQLGIFPSPKNYKFIDYHSQGSSDQSLVDLVEKPVFLNDKVVPDSIKLDQISYKDGSVAILGNNEYLIPILKASDTSFTYDTDRGLISSESTWHSGSQGFLISGYQARNNARTLWIGSESVLDNEGINQDLADSLLKWTFQINGVIRSDFFTHFKADQEGKKVQDQGEYKIKDFCKFEIGISEWNGHSWEPYNSSDVQLEFIMLDPYYRLTLPFEEVRDSAVYGTVFEIPDQHGMFTFKVDYKRSGLSFVEESTVVPVRHLANDEYPRSWEITNSWVYMASIGAVIVAWLLFVLFYIVSGEKVVVSEEKKKN
ncbi:DEKNAAC102085 [Brettanomyces naardenensis]|uniref:Dolichyl-diphosphooligosaccharide--protein glycosyltransferase subunit WBP1 n=1 Tax=Brettanomyces naardenensis TaxID=13370 RepID=A0A448YJK4_BRENA|nr:DEKNAAC102085 [Brettanomyces naardenensis]